MMGIAKIVDQYLEELEFVRRYSLMTIEAYKGDLLAFRDFSINCSKQNIEDITEKFIKSFLMKLSQSGLDRNSISRKLSALRGLFKYAFQNNYIEINPTSELTNPRLSRKLPGIISADSIEELYKIIDQKDDDPILVKAIFELLYGCALRRSELCNLLSVDVNLNNQTIRIVGKGDRTRIVPIGNKSKQILEEYIHQRSNIFNGKYFFTTSDGKKIYPQMVYRLVKKYLSQITDIKKRSPHILRHSAATHMLDNGADILAVKEILGHQNLSTTQIYTHVSIERLKSTYKKSHPKS
ncbi:MAG TPA: tyrosine-type recombinase/integrase [Ignavibacteriaceae bacterium]|nr:tyrosine-type recombinase/integrase [Ignavibacteriaceae bacterium]